MDCLPPHARTLPVIDSGERCTRCRTEMEMKDARIRSLEGLLSQTQRDLAAMTGEARYQKEAASILARQLLDARAAFTGPRP